MAATDPAVVPVNRAMVEFGGSDQWVLLRIWFDSPGVEGAWGPFPTEAAANEVKDLLIAGGVEHSNWAIVPLNHVMVDPMVTVQTEINTHGARMGPS